VGDFFQGVYGFNAADEKSFEWFEKFQNTKILPLSVSFRCSQAVIREAQKIVPDIKALPDAPEGCVRDGSVIAEAQSGDFILCRTTMPLVKLFFEFLTQKKKAIIKGSDIGLHLIELIGKINSIEKLITFWETELANFKRDLKAEGILNPYEHSGYSALEDKVRTLLFLAKLAINITDLKASIKTIFTDEIQGIVLSTVHKIKGLEANRVFIIRPDLLPMKNVKGWQWIQEQNLHYVAITRAKLELIYDRTWTDEE
jgi:superfamily I DNA/RNA helicase